jgi:hypothetical protein
MTRTAEEPEVMGVVEGAGGFDMRMVVVVVG